MNLVEFLQELSAKNVELWVDGGKLRYRGPQDILTPELLNDIKRFKEKILLLLQKRSETGQTIALCPMERNGHIPLSFAQQRMWFLQQLEINSSFYNLPAAMHFEGQLNVAALEYSLNHIISRHETLRTNFIQVDGQPFQVIHAARSLTLTIVDLRSHSVSVPCAATTGEGASLAESERKIFHQLAIEETQRPFDLATDPLVRASLFKLTETEHVLLLVMHHIVSDAWSMGVLIREITAVYQAVYSQKPIALPELPIQYADFAIWQRQWLQQEVLTKQLAYWKEQLQGATALLELPTDRPRPAIQTYRGVTEKFAFSKELSQALMDLSQRQGVTLFMTLMAAFQTLLYRYTDQTDICVGTPIANRNGTYLEGLIGLFLNTLVLRGNLSGNPSFSDLLLQVRKVALDAYAHQDLPFEQLVEQLQPERSLSHTPLFQVMFVLLNAPMPKLQLPDLTLSPLPIESATAKFDLTLLLENTTAGLIGSVEYNTDLFDAATIVRMVGHYQTLLEAVVSDPHQKLSELPLLSTSEQHQILVEWNNTQADYPKQLCLHSLFEQQVEKTPDAIAVVFESEQLTYSELNAKANQLAHHLHSLGVGPEVLVAICAERSIQMLVGLLAILKAGGAYVPLDPIYPPERLAYILEDACVSVLLTQHSVADTLPDVHERVVYLDSDWPNSQSSSNPNSNVCAENLAYAIYTSGSTGRPKGVQIRHGAVVNFLSAMSAQPGMVSDDVLVAVTTITFDIAALELFLPLSTGARVVLSRDLITDGGQSTAALATSSATVMQGTPATWRLLTSAGFLGNPQLKILCGGEALDRELAAQLLERARTLWNMYGPTETTIWSAVSQVQPGSGSVSIGGAIANTQFYILDTNLQPVPVGVAGELHIGGDGLARGYLNRPELTAEKFIPNPFSSQPGEKLYKTGDLVRYKSDGNIEYLGRIDHQVKVRGFRIELGEIEALLSQHSTVQQAVAIVKEIAGDKRLVAYLVPQAEATPVIGELRAFLQQQLPEYMVPSYFVMLDTLPLTPNGKVDRKALPDPSGQPQGEHEFVAPRTPIEEMLASIWASLLQVERVGIYDNFFSLGGHSLLATQLMSRLQKTVAVELPLRSLFELPTVAALAESIVTAQQTGQSQQTQALVRVPRQPEMPVSFAQQRLWFLQQLEPESGFYNIGAAVRFQGQLHISALEQSLNEIISRHEALRTNFVQVNGQAMQVIASSRTLTLTVVDLQQLEPTGREITCQQLATAEAVRPFDLGSDLLVRASLFQLQPTEHVLLLVMHHIVSDGWSMGVLVRELAQVYQAVCNEQPIALPELPIQYADFAHWQQQWLQEEVLAQQLRYWQQQLALSPALLELPTDRPRPAIQTYRGATARFSLSQELSAALGALSQKQEVTLFMTLLAAFQTLLYRYSGQTDICVGTPIANRNRAETEELIGLFVNTLVLRGNLSENSSFSDLLLQVREVALGAYAHQDLPFEQLVEQLQPERSLSYTPLFQVMFVLQNAPMPSLELADLTLLPLPIDISTAKFDLTLVLENTSAGLIGSVEYNTDLFDAATITRMVGHYQILLEAVVVNPDRKLSELPLLSASEQHQLLVEWNNTLSDYPQELCLHSLFEQQVQKTPNAIAVVFEDMRLTYGELNTKANQLAHYLQGLGVGPEVLVGVCVERSLSMVVGLLGILKAGGAYVPLDPAYPSARLAFMLSDSQVSVLLTQTRLVEKLPNHQARVVVLDTDWEAIAQQNQENTVSEVAPDNLAYVIYTSGSTGNPKGVAIQHHSPVTFVHWAKEVFTTEQCAGVLASTSICFDLSVFELFVPLSWGGKIILAENALHLPTLPAALEVTLINTVPSAIAELHRIDGIPARVSTVNLAGEPLQNQLVQKIYQHDSIQQVFNLYGPSEDTTYSTFALAEKGASQAPSIGCPIANTQVYILNAQMQPVPIGVAGELYISGAGLARGYLNRPDLNAEKFIPNPFASGKASERLYKTGDLVRYKRDGNIEYLGRIDHQVKVRGFRIELGEIEALLSQHSTVQQAVAIVKEIAGDKRLVAYLVPQAEATLATHELRSFLKQQLPEYMVPSYFVVLDALPLTPNGKVDRKALPDPSGQLQGEHEFVAPRTPIEEMLASIWASLLQVERVGIHDNFFSLGGHSLLATQLMSRLQKTFAVELPLRNLFELPTVAALAESIVTTQQTGQSHQTPPIVRVPRQPEMPVSFAQQRLWFLQQLEPDSGFYNIGVAVRFQGQLHISALEQSLNEIISRHEALRTNFVQVNGQAMQVIASSRTLTLTVVDLQQLETSEGEITCQQMATAEAVRPFDLASDLLVRGSLFQLQPTEHVLLLVMHHIVSDGWSIGVLVRDLAQVYQAVCNELPITLPELPIQYADFAHWQQQWLQEEVLAQQVRYWQQQLALSPTLLELPTDRPRPAIQTYRGATARFSLSQELSTALAALSQKQEVTLFMTLLAAFQTLLYRYSGQTDICVGTPIANRNRAETEELIGLFVNTLVLRSNLSENPSFRDLLLQVREVALGAYAHQDLPFEQLVEQLQPERSLSYTPLFQVMFVLQNAPMPSMELSDVTLLPLPIESGTAKFDLTLILENTSAGLIGSVEYSTDLFDAATITRMVGHYQTLLEAVVVNPHRKLSELPLLSASEQHQLLVEWNNTQADYPQLCLHSLFEQQVQKTPNAIAVVFEDERLTYSELNAKANQLAHHLHSLGVGPEVLVGVCVERSLEMVVGLLAILKAGGAYVPIDPEYPEERLAYMLDDSQVKVLLTQEKLVSRLAQQQAHLVCLDTNWYEIDQASPDNPISGVLPHHLAYVIYTSGSTGKPKGAMNTHQGVCNRLMWMQQAYQITPDDRILQKTPFSFDVSVWEFFWPLMTGARLVVAQPGGHRDSAYLVKLIANQEITTLHFVPSMLQVFLEEPTLESGNSLRQVFCSGEALPKELQSKFFARLGCSLHNLYGPTEAAIDVTYWQCQPDSSLLSVPIGRAIANTQIYILDRDHQPVPVGVAGELHIGGVGLARGYLNRPELTAEKFICHPFAPTENERLYKTGDLVRYLADGNIEYLGRIDHQVKVRGFRIELGEIEAILAQHPNVRETVVIAIQDLGTTRLVAYTVAHHSPAPQSGELRTFLKQKLPEYMVPSAFVALDALPLTPNGKLDRRALPKPSGQPELSDGFVAPRTAIEEILANIWASVLGIESVGIHDNFFELGGDSILTIQIVAKANTAGVQLSAKQMFEHQTIAELAAVAGTTAVIQAQQGVVSGTLPLTPVQQWFFAQNFSVPAHWNQALLLEMPPDIQPTVLEQVVQSILVHHDALRLRFESTDLGWQQMNGLVDDKVPLTVVDLGAIPRDQQSAAISAKAAELQGSLDLSSGPLVRVAWLNLGHQLNSRLLVVIHHLAVDGVSWRILLEDLHTAISQLSSGATLQLPPKTTSFKDWAQLQSEYVQSQDLQPERDFWLAQSQQPVANIPVDYPSGANTEASARKVSVSLSVEETRALLTEVPKAYNTQINDVLLTALVQVLADWTDSSYVRFNLEGHGREEIWDNANVSRTVGWFTTIFPVVLHQASNNPGEALKSIKEQLRRIPHQGMSYGWLRYLLEDTEIATQGPAQVIFNHLGQVDSVLQTSALFQIAEESSEPSRSPLNHRSHLLEVNSIIIGAQLQLDWTYSENLHQSNTIESLAQEYLQALRGLIAHCLAPDAGGYTPSDFPLAQLNSVVLEKLLSNVVPRQGITTTNWKNIADIYPLSSVQQGILFHTLYAPETGVYCQQLSCTFTGELDVEAFSAAWQQVISRHVVLRTAFTWSHSELPLQVVFRHLLLPLEIHSWIGLSPQQQQQQLQDFIEADGLRGFQLDKAPLMRLNLIQMSPDVYQFVWSYHHILIDGWSLPLVFKEVLGYYKAFSVGQELQLAPTRSYREYIAWLQKQNLAVAEQFWRQTLQGVTSPTPLVVDKTHHGKSEPSYREEILTLSSAATTALVSVARQHQLTLNTLVQAAWAILLWRYSGETDVVFGVTVSGRTAANGVESIVGLLINTLPMRVELTGEDTVLPWLKQIHKQQVEISTYEYTPLVQIHRMTNVPQGLPLFESIVVFENYPVDAALQEHSEKLHIDDVRTIERTNYPLTVVAQPGVQLSLRFIYDTQRFDSASITRMMGHFQTLLQGLVANLDQKLSHVPMLSTSERHQLLVEWNNTQVPYPQLCLHSLFEQQVQKTPNAIAVVFEDERLTYSQLNAKANQLGHYLQALGVGPEVLVGVCVERSLEMVIGLLGILKAGGAYVPIDPEYPEERLAYMLCDSQVKVLLTQEKLVSRLGEIQAQLVCLDTKWAEIDQASPDNPISGVLPHHLAYVIYTSGSTGKPKGAMNTHQGVCNRLMWMQQAYQITPEDRILQKTPFSFDVSVWEFFWPLMTGARLVVAQPGGHRDSAYLVKLIATEQITTLHFVPSMLQVFLEEPTLESGNSLRQVFCSGEALPKELQSKFFARVGCSLHNLYGPTEAAIDVTYWQCLPDSTLLSVPIGRAIANTQIYILDRDHQPVPVGVAGELHIGGVGLARGYLNRPELTAEKFICHPFAPTENERLYKTGDLVRYLPDGNIEYLGRIDHQVKVRGFRIELGEIEAVLAQHPNVRETVVIATQELGTTRLVAYTVAHHSPAPQSGELRAFLKQKLPEYMVPSVFVELDALPLTPNGKLDRRALPKPSGQPSLSHSFVAPRTAIEEILANIWASVLGIESVGIHDNFFELGGDSILTIQIIAKANSAGVHLSAKQMFEHQTIAELATVTSTVGAIQADQGVVSGRLPLTPVQQWFFAQNFSVPAHWNQALLLEMPPDIQPTVLEQVVQSILVHHDALRLRFESTDWGWQQTNALVDDKVPFTVVDLGAIPRDQQSAAISAKAAELQGSLDLSSGPLVRVAWLYLGEELNSRLLVVIHHLAVDGVSWRILLEDLHTAISQLSSGATLQLPPKTTSFKDWAQLQSEYVLEQDLQHHRDFWLSQSQQPVASIPVDYPRGVNTEASVRTVSVSLSVEQTRALLTEVPKAYNTQINDVLLTALVQVLADWTDSSYVRFNLEGHGREEIWDNANVSRTVGWFTTIFPVVLHQASNNPGEALKSIKEQLRRIPSQGMSYGWLRYLLDDGVRSAQLTNQEPAQVIFNHLGQVDSVLHKAAIFQLAPESSGPSRSPLNHRSHLLEINSIIIGAQLQLDWTYSENLHLSSTIESLAQEYLQALSGLISHCLAPDAGGYTPSDFPLAQLNSVVLEKLLSNVVPRQGITTTNWKNIADIYPLSSVQQGILFHTLYAPESGVYCQQLSCTFTGKLDIEAFSAAWQQVIARHTVLRTAFTWSHSELPLQVVFQQVKLPLEIHSWTELSANEQQQQLQDFIEADGLRGFQLDKAPLMRLSLIQMSPDVYQFVWSYHHILIDGWSLPLVFREVLGYYEALSVGQDLQLPPTRSYREYIAWLQKQNLAVAEQFWRQTLQGITSPTPLVVDKTHHGKSEPSYSEEILTLPRAATTALVSLARQHQLTLNTLVQAAWAILLGRYSGETDVVFGVTVSGRSPAILGVESIVGLLINTLPMRVELTNEDTVLPWLKQIHKQQVEITTYEYTPLVQIQSWSDVPRGLPLFESIVVFENYPVDAALQQYSEKLHIDDVRTIERTNYPLMLVAQPGVELSLRFIYDTQRFDPESITRMMGHFQTLLQGLVANLDQKLSHVPMLSASERHQLLVEWNNTLSDYPQQLCLHSLFEQQVEKTPDAIAVVFEDERLTYSELNVKANQLAHHLHSLGVGPEVLVGICTERSTLMVVGLLAILKAGGAYVPLDPIYPPERLAYILEDACVSVLLTQQAVADTLPDVHGRVVYLDSDWPIHQSSSNPNSNVCTENLAYAIYTSGSTGRPKGVQIRHRAVVNFLSAMSAQPGMVSSDVLVAVTTITFDIAALELFLPLSLGARVVLSRDLIADGGQSTAALATSTATVMQGTPATWRALTSAGFLGNPQLKILCGGEALDRELATQLLERADSLWNMYGPTETTIWSAVSQVQPGSGSVSIGGAIANTQFYILDTNLQPVPVGVAGELHIGGDGLARGYLNRPELTAEKFIPNPFSSQPGEKLYKTGDLVRYNSDGNIEYLGRIDHQVKVRGFRIELAEIEALLSQHPTVQQAVVIAKEIAGDKRLIAYLLPQTEATPAMSELRSFLQQQLPDYMVPSYFIALDTLPLTPNGKVDRNALPDPEHTRPEVEAYVAPRNEVEQIISTVWQEVLNLEKVGVNDNFFELGGHSLLIVQLHSKLNQKLLGNINRDISVVDLFKYPTISTLAQYFGQEQDRSAPTLQKINDRASKQIEALKRQPSIKRRKKTNG